jgi:cell wall-associated NlpC family hydrolase
MAVAMSPAISKGKASMSDPKLRPANYPGESWAIPRVPSPQRLTSPEHPKHPEHPKSPERLTAPERPTNQQRPANDERPTNQQRPTSRRRRLLASRPVVMSAVVCTMICALVSRPAYGDPGASLPDSGARPLPAGQVVYPGQGTATNGAGYVATPVLGPFASQVMAEDIAVQALGEQVKQLQIDLQAAEATAQSTETTWHDASAKVDELRAAADSAAANAYKAAAGLGPLGDYATDLHDFSVIAPGIGGQPGGQEAARDLLRAQQEEKSANDAYQTASKIAQNLRGKFNSLNGSFEQRTAALVQLKAKNAGEYAKAVAQSDAYEQSLGGTNLALNQNIDGMQANPKAVQAVNWAMSKRGSPYVWGTEGPNTFDCSGLAYWSYGKVGVRVPRVAADMYHGTQAIVATRYSRGDLLLPGDLVYFATNASDWRTIYHMGIYIGGGRMVQAPSTGDVVKVSSVSWSRFFGATRIFPPVPKAGATVIPPPPPPTGGATTGGHTTPPSTPSASHSATPTPSHSASPTPSASHTATPTPSATHSTPDPSAPAHTPAASTAASSASASRSAATSASAGAPPSS